LNNAEKKKSPNWWAIALVVLAIAVLTVLYFYLKGEGLLGMFSSAEAFREWLSQFGAWAPIIFFLLQILQVAVAFIPGEVTSVAGGIMFGFWGGLILSITGITAGSAVAFAIARQLGRPAVVKMAGSAVLEKYMDAVNRNSVWLLFSMFLLPFFPKDALCYVAGLTGIAWPVFLLLSFLGRLPGQVMSTLVGAGLLTVPVWGWVVIVVCAAGLVYLSFRYAEKINEWLMGVLRRKM
jgi:uncharacterized membrane protein YdjX (TVP38/TMEM64 family)